MSHHTDACSNPVNRHNPPLIDSTWNQEHVMPVKQLFLRADLLFGFHGNK
jgi:hypothetical protein